MSKIQIFNQQKIRSHWDAEQEKWYFAVIDVISVLSESPNPMDYLKKMRKRDEQLSKGWGQIVTPLLVETPGGAKRRG